MTASANSEHFSEVEPGIISARSNVTVFAEIAPETPFTTRSAASFQPRWRNIISAESSSEDGFALSSPASFGAVPCVASKIACPVFVLMFPPGAMPMPPTCAASASET